MSSDVCPKCGCNYIKPLKEIQYFRNELDLIQEKREPAFLCKSCRTIWN